MFSLKWSNMLSQLCASHKYDRFKIVCWVCFVRNLWVHLEKVFITENIIQVTAPQLEVLTLQSFAICKPFHSFYSQMRLKYIIKHTVILKSEMFLQQLVVLRGNHQLKLWLKMSSFLFPLMYPLFTYLHEATLQQEMTLSMWTTILHGCSFKR